MGSKIYEYSGITHVSPLTVIDSVSSELSEAGLMAKSGKLQPDTHEICFACDGGSVVIHTKRNSATETGYSVRIFPVSQAPSSRIEVEALKRSVEMALDRL
jgi:hypothetical protein